MRRLNFTGGIKIKNKGIYIDNELIPASHIDVSRDKILRLLKVPDDKSDDFLNVLINDLILYCKGICNPLASCTIFLNPDFTTLKGKLKIKDSVFNIGSIVSKALVKSSEIALFIGTVGENIELYSKKLISEGNALEGLIVNLIGSELAENIAEYIQKKLSAEMAENGLNTTIRYSPGYCNWDVSDQQYLFKLMNNNSCGVHLNSSSLMIPVKSVSGIIGIGKNVENNGYMCRKCRNTTCIHRQIMIP